MPENPSLPADIPKDLTAMSQTQIDPLLSFLNSQGQSVRGTIITLQRKSLVMEVYNPYSIVQVSEVLTNLTIRLNARNIYTGKAVITNIVNTGLTAIVSVTLTDEWRELSEILTTPSAVGVEARAFVQDWARRFRIGRNYQIVVNELRAFLSEISRWVEQVDLSESLPKVNDRLQDDYFRELAAPLIEKTGGYFKALEYEASQVEPELAPAHRAFCQAALHPLMMRAPFVYRTFTKPLGYAGDYMMVNQLIDDPRQGPTTYFQIVNAAFLSTSVAAAHRNRIDILVDFLMRMAQAARAAGRPFRILNVGCGPAIELQRFITEYAQPGLLQFELLDFSAETLDWTRDKLAGISRRVASPPAIEYVQDSVHHLLKRRVETLSPDLREFDAVYCAGLFDYLSDKVCMRLLSHFAARTRPGGRLLVTNVHPNSAEKFGLEHLLEWYLIYRDESRLAALLPPGAQESRLFVDATGVNVFAEMKIG
jgi:extracellular factor (EF) 3-hydroxypalmitic acid methyl ester biosynthesis protein